MGGFFNSTVMSQKKIPNIFRAKGSLEKARRLYNATLRSTETEQDRGEPADGASIGESAPVIPTDKVNRPRSTRRTNKKRARQARDNK